MRNSRSFLLSALLVLGCNTPGSRIKKHEELFATYPPDEQAAIRSGEIRQGFDQNQVYMALGKADKKTAEGPTEAWVYTKVLTKAVTTKKDVYKYKSELQEYEAKTARGEYAIRPSTEETTVWYRTRVTRIVKFTDGRVTSWDDPSGQYLSDWHK